MLPIMYNIVDAMFINTARLDSNIKQISILKKRKKDSCVIKSTDPIHIFLADLIY